LYAFAVTPSSSWGEQDDYSSCGSGTQLELGMCAEENYKAADKELNRLYVEMMKQSEAEGKKNLKESQKAWLNYRDKACAYEGGLFDGGSGWALAYYGCKAHFTKERNAILRRYLGCLSKDCPQ
jgi:uncharacterized protein YecT (DUF1311 family)